MNRDASSPGDVSGHGIPGYRLAALAEPDQHVIEPLDHHAAFGFLLANLADDFGEELDVKK